MSDAFWAYGSLLQLGDGGSPEAFTSIAEITKLTPPNETRDAIEVTHTTSTDGRREFIPGWRDSGEISFEANWLPDNSTHDQTTGLYSTFDDDALHNWRIVVPDVVQIDFAGFITAHEPDLPMEEQAKLSGTIKISGKPTFTSL